MDRGRQDRRGPTHRRRRDRADHREAHASEALGDLALTSGQTGLTEAEVKRLARTVSASSIEILTGKDDRLLRRLRLSVALDVPPELRPKTGGTTALEVKVDMALRKVNRPVRVNAPGGA